MHEEWTDKLSEYLDDELAPDERRAVDAHMAECAECARTLAELRRVVDGAHAIRPRPPATDLWDGIAGRLDAGPRAARADRGWLHAREPRRFTFSMPQLAAAAVVIAAVAAGVSARLLAPARAVTPAPTRFAAAPSPVAPAPVVSATPVGFADAQYDAAVGDLERALKSGRGKLDASTIAALEQSLQTIDQALEQARQALAADPSNSYLSSHLVETRRKKLDFLRRATALTETN